MRLYLIVCHQGDYIFKTASAVDVSRGTVGILDVQNQMRRLKGTTGALDCDGGSQRVNESGAVPFRAGTQCQGREESAESSEVIAVSKAGLALCGYSISCYQRLHSPGSAVPPAEPGLGPAAL